MKAGPVRCRLATPGQAVFCAALLLMAALTGGCTREGPPDTPTTQDSLRAPLPTTQRPLFTDQTEEAGLDFVHFNGMSGGHSLPEITGAGGALFDYDNDGDLDLYLVQGRMFEPGKSIAEALVPPKHEAPLTDRLYRNDLTIEADGSRTLRFVDVTAAAGLQAYGYGMGVAAGDVNSDGWIDLYVTNLGANQMLRNNGDCTFTDVTAVTGTDDPRFSVSAAFFDYDRDGWLDLFVGNYVTIDFDSSRRCFTPAGAQDYCGPLAYDPQPNRLFRNRGDGTFEPVTVQAGMQGGPGSTLGVVTADFNSDGWLDIYVANDGMANRLWMNQQDGTFVDEALLSGTSVNGEGFPEASMGVDAGDYDNDGDEDLFLAHLTRESNTLYTNTGTGLFTDHSTTSRLGGASWNFTGFGTAFFDYDNDGWLDILVVNGAVKIIEALANRHDPYPLHQPNQLFRNRGDARFEEVTQQAGEAFAVSEVSRGAVFGDLDNDGDTDVVIVNNSGPARVLINEVGHTRHWLGLRLVDAQGRRDMLGAWVATYGPDQAVRWRRARTDGSYASSNDPRLLIGLGSAARVETLHVRWPGGHIEAWTNVTVDTYLRLQEGTGHPVH